MKLSNRILLISVIVLFTICSMLVFKCMQLNKKEYTYIEKDHDSFEYNESYDKINERIFEKGCIQDSKTAAQIAFSIFETIYGEYGDESVYRESIDKMPLTVYFDKQQEYWIVRSQLPTNYDVGGGVNIVLRKSDAKVVAIWQEQ